MVAIIVWEGTSSQSQHFVESEILNLDNSSLHLAPENQSHFEMNESVPGQHVQEHVALMFLCLELWNRHRSDRAASSIAAYRVFDVEILPIQDFCSSH